MSKQLRIILLLVLLAVIGALYILMSTPDYGDTNADGLKLGQAAAQQGDFDAAAKWFRLAAKKGDKQAQYLFAMLYRDGKGVDRNDIQAVRWLKLAAAQHYSEAQYQLGSMLEHGRGVDAADATAAFKWFHQAARAGHAGAQLHLAVMYAQGNGVKKSIEQALDWAFKASASGNSEAKSYVQQLLNRINAKALAGDPAAQFVLARIYEQGQGLHADINKAEQWLRQSAASGNAGAQFHLAELLLHRNSPQTLQQAADLYLKAARQGHDQAAAKIGAMYATGQGVTRNRAEAVHWLEKAAEGGQGSAQSNLGIILASEQQDKQAVGWLRKAAKSGEADAQNNLAVMLALGRGVRQNMRAALKWLKQAAAEEDTLAQYNLGLLYVRGTGIFQNEESAADWLEKAQTDGDVQARLLLGLLYDLGRGVIVNAETAKHWYGLAADAGNADAIYNLAALYYRKGDFNKAFELFERAAGVGDVEAQTIVASMYQQGQGADFDMQKAVQWYEQAAEHGYAPAQFNLANLYRKGDGLEQQDKTAFSWYLKASRQGFAPAQNSLAYMYAQGRGVATDREKAFAWLQKAADQGLAIAENNLSLLKQKQSGFTLTSLVVEIQTRADILTEKPLDLARRLQLHLKPTFHSQRS